MIPTDAHLATVVQSSPKVVASWSGGEVELEPSITLSTAGLANGDRLLVVQADDGGFYAIEYIGV